MSTLSLLGKAVATIGVTTAGDGTATLVGGGVILANSAANADAAAAYLLIPTNETVGGTVTIKAKGDGAIGSFVSLRMQEGTPAASDFATVIANTRVLAPLSAGSLNIIYYSSAGVATYWTGSVWSTTPTNLTPAGYSINTEYTHIYEYTTTQWRYTMKSSDELTTYYQTSWVLFSATRDAGGDATACCGDLYTNAHITNATISEIRQV